jgi:hypothetical protein
VARVLWGVSLWDGVCLQAYPRDHYPADCSCGGCMTRRSLVAGCSSMAMRCGRAGLSRVVRITLRLSSSYG